MESAKTENGIKMNTEMLAKEFARRIENGKGKNVILLDVSKLSSWTNYFIIATITSGTHCQGLIKDAKDFAKENKVQLYETQKKMKDGDDWNLLDFGDIVIHLFSEDARSFYDLEKLWHSAKKIEFIEN